MAESIDRQKAIGSENGWSSDVDEAFGRSPLSSLSPSRSSSLGRQARPPSPDSHEVMLASQPLPPEPTTSNEGHEVVGDPQPSVPHDSTTAPPMQKKKGRKKHSHEHRRRQRQLVQATKALGSALPREKTLRKHVKPSNPIRSAMEGEKIRIASTGYIGVRQRKSSRVYTLEELTGKGSRFGLKLIEWDGR